MTVQPGKNIGNLMEASVGGNSEATLTKIINALPGDVEIQVPAMGTLGNVLANIINTLPDDEFEDLMIMLGWEDKLIS